MAELSRCWQLVSVAVTDSTDLRKVQDMKKGFIIFVLAVFALYCYLATVQNGSVPVPQYLNVTIDLMNGMSQAAWNRDPTGQKEYFRELERRSLQPPATGWHFSQELTFSPDYVLKADDFRRILEAQPVTARDLPVRDPGRIIALSDKDYRLRDNIVVAGKPLLAEGSSLDKAAIDRLLAAGFSDVRIVGKGGMVSPEAGTMLMVVLIFLGLLCALRIVLFDPLVALVDERNAEIELGQEQARENRKRAALLEQEALQKRRALRRQHMSDLVKARHAVMREADSILHEANVEAHRLRDNAHLEMKKVVAEAEKTLRGEVEGLARQILEQVTGRAAGGRS